MRDVYARVRAMLHLISPAFCLQRAVDNEYRADMCEHERDLAAWRQVAEEWRSVHAAGATEPVNLRQITRGAA